MTISELISLLENQITTLNGLRITAYQLGDVSRVIEIDTQITETKNTILQLRSL